MVAAAAAMAIGTGKADKMRAYGGIMSRARARSRLMAWMVR
jgi:hypothetical protein